MPQITSNPGAKLEKLRQQQSGFGDRTLGGVQKLFTRVGSVQNPVTPQVSGCPALGVAFAASFARFRGGPPPELDSPERVA